MRETQTSLSVVENPGTKCNLRGDRVDRRCQSSNSSTGIGRGQHIVSARFFLLVISFCTYRSFSMDDVPTGEGSRLIVLLCGNLFSFSDFFAHLLDCVHFSRPCTPVRSGTLNNPGAYPSPESAPRQVSSAPSTSYLTPSRSRSTSAPAVDEIQRDEDEEMEVSIELQGSSNVLFASVRFVHFCEIVICAD